MAFKKKTKTAGAVEAPVIAAELTPEEQVAADEANAAPIAEDEAPVIDRDRLVQVWERRFQNPGEQASVPVQLKIKGMVVRWVNTSIEGRHHRAVYSQGWQPVPRKLLADAQDIPDLYKHPHGIVARGERGKEVLMMMPAEVYERIQRKKAELNTKALRNIRSEMASAASSKFGAEAGDFINRGGSADGTIKTVGSVNFGVERVPMGSE